MPLEPQPTADRTLDDPKDLPATPSPLMNAAASTPAPRDGTPAAPPTRAGTLLTGGSVTEVLPPSLRGLAVPGYEILGELGHGGMGVVYKARHVKLDRLVALKMILASKHASLQDQVRFQIEAEAVARLQHPNIVQLHEVSEHDGMPFFSLEFCVGGSVDRKLKSWKPGADEAAVLVETLARAMHYAHLRGVVHRDLKPANVLLTADGIPKITDFGLAKKMDGGSDVSRSGAIMGTPSYMAPEQAAGRVHDTGPAADVYALGALLYELLAGQPPFKGETAFQTVQMVLTEEPTPPSTLRQGVPRDLETIALKCLRKEPARRYASAEDLADDLRRSRQGEPITARPVGKVERFVKWVKRRPAAAGILALVSVLIVVVFVAFGLVAAQLRETQAALKREEDAKRERKKAEKDKVLARVAALRNAAPGAVTNIILELRDIEGDEALPTLREQWAAKDEVPQIRMRIGLALLHMADANVRDDLAGWLLKVSDPAEMLVVRDYLALYYKPREQFWKVAEDAKVKPAERFRALVALAAFDPEGKQWAKQAPAAVEQMLASNPLHLGIWEQALRPVGRSLLPPLSEVFRTAKSPERREFAATVLADYSGNKSDTLADLLLDADARQFAVIFPKLCEFEAAPALLQKELDKMPAGDWREPQKEALARRQANGAVALLRLGLAQNVWPLFRHSSDPTRRSELLARVAPLGIEARQFADRLLKDEEKDVSARRALILALGDYTAEQVPPDVRGPLTAKLLTWYRDDPDPGIHAAVDWLLRQGKEGPVARPLDWGQAAQLKLIDTALKRRDPDETRRWYVNGQGQTMVVVPGPLEFRMGAPLSETNRQNDETPHRRRIERNYAISSRSVTVEEFQRFLKERPDVTRLTTNQYNPEADCPIIGVSWYMAAQYCNWLSEKEGLPESEWCYPKHANIKNDMTPYPDYLKRHGYRLPTEAEWEYSARAGAASSRYYGSSLELLPRYAWCIHNAANRTWPVGQKRPNDFGLFDSLGNVWNWVYDPWAYYPKQQGTIAILDIEDIRDIKDSNNRVLRGGSFLYQASSVRLAFRYDYRPSDRNYAVGMRPARTLP